MQSNLIDYVGIGKANKAKRSLTRKYYSNSNLISRIYNNELIQVTNINNNDSIFTNKPTPLNFTLSLKYELSLFSN